MESAAPFVIPAVEPALAEGLRRRAARHGRSPEAEALTILRAAVAAEPGSPPIPRTGEELVAAILELFGPENGVDLELPPKEMIGEPRVRFD